MRSSDNSVMTNTITVGSVDRREMGAREESKVVITQLRLRLLFQQANKNALPLRISIMTEMLQIFFEQFEMSLLLSYVTFDNCSYRANV